MSSPAVTPVAAQGLEPLPLGGYVLAGGRSTRMGQDKALLELGGRTFAEVAVRKLRTLCAEVSILSSNPALSGAAPLVADRQPGCGPLGGIEAALAHTSFDWNLILPVDLPFVPAAELYRWAAPVLAGKHPGASAALFRVADVPQPTLLLIRRALAPALSAALRAGHYKLFPVLARAAADLAEQQGMPAESGLHITPLEDVAGWFANLNTPGEFAEAERRLDDLEPF